MKIPIVENPLSYAVVICSFKHANAIAVKRLCLSPNRLSVYIKNSMKCSLISNMFSNIFKIKLHFKLHLSI